MDLLEYLSQQIAKASLGYKRKYRQDMVKAIINSYPEGTPIRGTEFHKALQYEPRSSGGAMLVSRMIQRGEISRRLLNNPPNAKDRRYAYKVLKPGNTYIKERNQQPGQEAQVTEVAVEKQTNLVKKGKYLMEKTYTFEELEALAMKYQFYRNNGVMTVAEFLTKLKEV